VHHRNAEWIGESTMSNKLLSRPAGSAATGSLDMVTGLSSNVCRGVAAGTRVGRYRIESYLDRGGMASVYEATDLHLNRRVALKVLVAELADDIEMRERFVRESRFAASLEHPNIVPIYDAGEVEGLLYIAMRLVRGTNLAGFLRSAGPMEPALALSLLAPAAGALDAAHAMGLVHRDVKPANILLAMGRAGHRHVYLADFGVTKRVSASSDLTVGGTFVGTMEYTSPEQIRGEGLDFRSDLYALGCVAYQCLTGSPPFVRDDQAALLWAHLAVDPPPVSARRKDLALADPVIARCLAKSPQDRFQTCGQFIEALADAVCTGRHRSASAHHGVGAGSVTHRSAVTGRQSQPENVRIELDSG
jgi:serine/threonine protein kinase